MKECYQCGKEVQWLAPDSRCGDCTRLTPEQVQGIDPMPDEAEQELDKFCSKYGLKEEDFDEEEDMNIMAGYVKDNYVQLNILSTSDFTAYDLYVNGHSVAYKQVAEDKELLSFINDAEKAMSKVN